MLARRSPRLALLLLLLLSALPLLLARAPFVIVDSAPDSTSPLPPVSHSSTLKPASPTSTPHSATSTPTPSPVVRPSTATPPPPPPSPPAPPRPSPPTSGLLAPAPDTWAIRLSPPYYLRTLNSSTVNGARNIEVRDSWSIASVSAAFAQSMGAKEAERQQKRLDRHVARMERRLTWSPASSNASTHQLRDGHEGGHHHRGGKHYSELSSFYLRHAQCRACVGSNLDLLQLVQDGHQSGGGDDGALQWGLPQYQPVAVMKWCSSQTPLLAHEQAVSAFNPSPLQDWEGVCVPATSSCPSTTVDLNILSPTTCAGDAAVTKQSCALCVMDGYEWRTHERAVRGGDNYDGLCHSSPQQGQTSPWSVSVRQLDLCPSVLASMRAQSRVYQMSGAFFLFFTFTSGLCLCLALRRCCAVRKAKSAARAAAISHANVPIAAPVISSSVAQPAASSASVYPGQHALAVSAALQRGAAPSRSVAMQEPLLVSSGLNPPMYPQLSSNPPPYAYGYRA